MDTILLIFLVILLGATLGILYLNLRSKPKDENESKEAEELANLNAEIVKLKFCNPCFAFWTLLKIKI